MGQELDDGAAVPAGLRLADQILGEGAVPVLGGQADREFEPVGVDVAEAGEPFAQAVRGQGFQGAVAGGESVRDDAEEAEGGLAGGAVPVQRGMGRHLDAGRRSHRRHDPLAVGRRLDPTLREPFLFRFVEALPEGRGGFGVALTVALLIEFGQ
ncbi:hypothetical protein PUR21_03760 [Methylorubrum rhodesianum]|uniref:Uncharacterized protein n=1 Tax=Methylorubrum rhodesianum TaxID=29427 RepID=A0ABU9Z6A7_9HYPH